MFFIDSLLQQLCSALPGLFHKVNRSKSTQPPSWSVRAMPFATCFPRSDLSAAVSLAGRVWKLREWPFIALPPKRRGRPERAPQPAPRRAAGPYLEAEEADGADDEVLPGGAGGRQDGRQVVDAQGEEEDEAEQVAPDVDGLVGEDEEAVRRHNGAVCVCRGGVSRGWARGPGAARRGVPHLLRQRREGR